METDNCENCQKQIRVTHPQMEGIPLCDSSFICMKVKGPNSGFYWASYSSVRYYFFFGKSFTTSIQSKKQQKICKMLIIIDLFISQRDSGSPLTFLNRTQLLGIAITDRGTRGCHFVRVSHHYVWIKKQMRKRISTQ